jgi:hypothetical protein
MMADLGLPWGECVPCEDDGRANRLARFGEPFNWEGSMVIVAQWDII